MKTGVEFYFLFSPEPVSIKMRRGALASGLSADKKKKQEEKKRRATPTWLGEGLLEDALVEAAERSAQVLEV